MHDRERLISAWRQRMKIDLGGDESTLDELENHLREHMDALIDSGIAEETAFHRSVAQLGDGQVLRNEFQKLPSTTWWPLNLITGLGLVGTVALAALLLTRMGSNDRSMLLTSHVFALTLGYGVTFMIGALGVCYVAQRFVAGFSCARSRMLQKAVGRFGWMALGMTLVGVTLGMAWAEDAWGRYWTWSAKELGALGILLWQACFLGAQRLFRKRPTFVLILAILGNIVVAYGWFGTAGPVPQSIPGYGTTSILLASFIAVHLFFTALGLAPVGRVRSRRRI